MIKKITTLLILAIFALISTPVGAQEEPAPSASGFNNLRIEQEKRIFVPLEKRDEVWNFIKSRFVDDKEFVTSLHPSFTTFWEQEEFWDVYYDTPSLQMLESQNGVRHRRRINLTNPDSAKDGRELMQIKITGTTDNPLNRGEIKFDIEHPKDFKTPDDRHPLIGIVKPEHREDLKKRIQDLGVDPYEMKPIFTVHDIRSRIYLTENGEPFISISFDEVDTQVWWKKIRYIELEPELNEIAYTEANAEKRAYMESIRDKLMDEISAEFPELKQDLTPKYNKSFNALEAEMPYLKTLFQYNLHTTQSLMLLLTLLLVPIIAIVIFVAKQIRKKTSS